MKTSATSSGAGQPTSGKPKLYDAVCPESLRDQEIKLLNGRKPANPKNPHLYSEQTLGLALSGGGIRSATFCLGFLQALAKHEVLPKVDFLSTVSGGGYIGGFLGALITRAKSLAKAQDKLLDPFSFPMQWLRENGRYLAPNGSGDLLAALAVQIRNCISVQIVMALFAGWFILLANTLRAWLESSTACGNWLGNHFPMPALPQLWWWSPQLALFVLPAYVTVTLGWSYWLIRRWRNKAWYSRPDLPHYATVVLAIAGVLWAFLWAAPLPVMLYVCLVEVCALPTLVLITWGITWFVALHKVKQEAPATKQTAAAQTKPNAEVVAPDPKAGNTPPQDTSTEPPEPRKEAVDRQRRLLTDWLAWSLALTGILLVFGLLDSAGQSLYLGIRHHGLSFLAALTASVVGGLLSLGPKLANAVQRLAGRSRFISLPMIAAVCGLAGILLFLLVIDALVHALGWLGADPWESDARIHPIALSVAFGAVTVLIVVVNCVPDFLHTSSLQMLYGFRLARAYFGASNSTREDTQKQAVTDLIPGDDIWLPDYQPHAFGGPIHLINLTFNETCSAKSNIEQRDRKGLSFAVGPCGLSVGRRYHAGWAKQDNKLNDMELVPPSEPTDPQAFVMFPKKAVGANLPVENISVGHWIAVSGAAVGCGLGARTTLGLSLLSGLANIRLGYWWNSNIQPRERLGPNRPTPKCMHWWGAFREWAFPVHSYLLDEWLARFHGPARPRWYLSDGGHFENTAVYELLRRRLPYIVCCDCGEDAEYEFEDAANLVRKARIDFKAEISFVSRDEFAKARLRQDDDPKSRTISIPQEVVELIGTPQEFQTKKKRKRHGLLATVTYEGHKTPGSIILFVKPALASDEPLDLVHYHETHSAFPHESTADQFFAEAQWESYRKLGEHSGEVLVNSPLWWFTRLEPTSFVHFKAEMCEPDDYICI